VQPVAELLVIGEAAIIGTSIKSEPTRAERMQALRDAPPFSITGLSTLANSLQIPCSLLKIPC
jgi:hypothetical protein